MATVTMEADSDNKVVAVKTLSDGDNRNRLAWEHSVLERFAHPGVVELIDATTTQLRTRFVSSHTLGSRPPTSVEEIAGVGIRLARTLADLHDLGLVHHRVTADHVLLGRGGQPILCGLAESTTDGVGTHHDVTAVVALLRSSMARGQSRSRWWRQDPVERSLEKVLDEAIPAEGDTADGGTPNRQPMTMRKLANRLAQAVPTARLPEPAPEEPDTALTSGQDPVVEETEAAESGPVAESGPLAEAGPLAESGAAVESGASAPERSEEPPAEAAPPSAPTTAASGDAWSDGLSEAVASDQGPVSAPEPVSELGANAPSPSLSPPGHRITKPRVAAALAAAGLVVVAGLVVMWPDRTAKSMTADGGGQPATTSLRNPPPAPAVVRSTLVEPTGTSIKPIGSTGDGRGEAPDGPANGTDDAEGRGAEVGGATAESSSTTVAAEIDIPENAGSGAPTDQPPIPPVEVDGNTITFDGARFSVGERGDLLAAGTFRCDGEVLAALFRPGTGEVFVFGGWASGSEAVTGELVSVIPDGVSIEAGAFVGPCQQIRIVRSIGEPALIVLDEETT